MKYIFYKIIYNYYVNWFLLRLNKLLASIFPSIPKLPPSGILKTQVNGSTLKLCTNQTSYITQFIFWNGYQNFEYTKLFEKLITKVDVFFDIGANIGYYSLLGSHLNSKLQIFGFEPSKDAWLYYNKNIIINNMTNKILPYNFALSNKNGQIKFNQVVNRKYGETVGNLSGEATVLENMHRSFESYIVNSITLDDFVEENKISKIDFIKIDTEGSEKLILEGAKNTLKKFRPIVVCETLFNIGEKELEDIMINFDYEMYNHVGEKLVKVDTICRIKDNGVRNCFFVHPDKRELIREFL